MRKEQHNQFVRDGGRTYNIHFSPPLSTLIDQAVTVERRTYKEVFRCAMEAYLHNYHSKLLAKKEVGNA